MWNNNNYYHKNTIDLKMDLGSGLDLNLNLNVKIRRRYIENAHYLSYTNSIPSDHSAWAQRFNLRSTYSTHDFLYQPLAATLTTLNKPQ